jgi:signal peptidase I
MPDMYETPWQTFFEIVKVVVVAFAIALVIRSFILQPYIIPSGSMLNTLQVGDRLFVTKFSYGIHLPFLEKEIFSLGEPERGDIIVFPFPNDKSVDYIKRVVGVPGDVIEIRDKQLYRNDKPVREDYVVHNDPHTATRRDNMKPVLVPPGKVFVMGDNRDYSEDSRFWGFVDKDAIHGRAAFIYWSSVNFVNVKWSRIGTLLR